MSESVEDAMKLAVARTPNDATILITGSLYLVGEVRRLLKSQI
jgi:folylpolyglutamate synthase/dihydropteroate synthase